MPQVDLEVLMMRISNQLSRLVRTKDSIHRATSLALEGAAMGAAPRIIRTVVEQLKAAQAPARRIDLFYLVDSIAQVRLPLYIHTYVVSQMWSILVSSARFLLCQPGLGALTGTI